MKQHNAYRIIPLLLVLLIIVSSCVQAPEVSPDTSNVSLVSNEPTQPIIKILDLSALPPTPTSTSIPSPSPIPTREPSPTSPPTATEQGDALVSASNTSAAAACSNQAEFIQHLTLPDNVALKAGKIYTKIWQIKNVGTCTWTTEYGIVFIGGESFQSPMEMPLPQEVLPDETIDLRVKVTIPAAPSAYEGNWMLQDEAGNQFGVGGTGDRPLALKIDVPEIIKFKPR